MNEKQIASMTAWENIPATDQMEIVTKAAKRAAFLAGAYGVTIAPDELIGATWIGIVERLEAGRLDKDNERRTAEGKAPLTIMQIAHRAAHSAAEIIRYDHRKHDAFPLESWKDADGVDMESSIIDRLTVTDFIAQRDSRDQAIAAYITTGYTERQTGESIGISGVAVHKRLAKMRTALAVAVS